MFSKSAICVMGMHRSGTSLVTQMLAEHGCELPGRLLGAGEGNLDGHFEPAELVDLHDALLGEQGLHWADIKKPDPDSHNYQLRYSEKLFEILNNNYSEHVQLPAVIKEPRTSIFA